MFIINDKVSKHNINLFLFQEGYTPLNTAVRFGKFKVVEVLAGVGASVCEGGGPVRSL